jgi:hypothetical protein
MMKLPPGRWERFQGLARSFLLTYTNTAHQRATWLFAQRGLALLEAKEPVSEEERARLVEEMNEAFELVRAISVALGVPQEPLIPDQAPAPAEPAPAPAEEEPAPRPTAPGGEA